MKLWALVVAGGSGTRFGGPKQLAALGSLRVIDHSVAAVAPAVEGVVVVGEAAGLPGRTIVVPGGPSRSASVRAGLAVLPDDATHVLVHDAARPLASAAVVDRVVRALAAGAAGAVPVVPVVDTLRTVEGEPVDRSGFVAVQTPQGFRLDDLRAAHAAEPDATDDATLVSRRGGEVVHTEGDPANLKITVPHDLVVAAALLEGGLVG